MTQPAQLCPGVPFHGRSTFKRCTECGHYRWGATGMQPLMRQERDGTWHCVNEVPRGGRE